MNIDTMKSRLDAFPEKYRDQLIKLYQKKHDIISLQERIKKIEFVTNKEVSLLSGQEEHKKDLSNAEKRKSKYDVLLRDNNIYITVQSDIVALKDSQDILEIEVKSSRLRFDADLALIKAFEVS